MIKPILKMEVPSGIDEEGFVKITESLKGSDVTKDYYLIVVQGTNDYYSFEIITAPDIKLHQDL